MGIGVDDYGHSVPLRKCAGGRSPHHNPPPQGGEGIFFFFNDTAPTEIYTLSLHDALPISCRLPSPPHTIGTIWSGRSTRCTRSEEHTSELQSRRDLVCRLLLEKKKKN